jgi:hypothetical protein
MSGKTYGILAEFDSPAAILSAAEKVRDAGYSRWDVFTPFPIHGMDKVMSLKNSLVGWVALAGGAFMFLNVVGLIWFANAFVPAYIMMIMGAAVGALIGMFAFNELPRFHHPLFQSERFALVSRDKFFLLIGALDEKFSESETRKLLESVGGAHIEIIED